MAQAQTVETVRSGLFSDAGKCIPLKGVSIGARIQNAASRVTVSQRYHNTEAVPVEAVYSFPLQESSAVCGFEVEIGDRRITGRVEEKEAAFEAYDDAMAEGHGAYLLDQNRPNIFTASVGNLLPGQEAVVHITYVTELDRADDRLRLMIPTTVSPRYIPPKTARKMDPAELAGITPPTAVGGVPYGLHLSTEIETTEKIRSIESPSHHVQMTMLDGGARVELVGDQIQLDQDFVLTVQFTEMHKPMVVVAKDREQGYAAMVNFLPDVPGEGRQPQEVVFLLDRSGSMMGESIEQAKKALQLCLRSLREGDLFNIVGYGSSHESLFPRPTEYQQETLDKAAEHVQYLDADLGGTELYAPLQEIFRNEPRLPRQIILLTDGQVGNEKDIIDLVRIHSNTTRIFSFGIGRGASEYLVKEIAQATKGASEFIFPGERIEPKVLKQFERVGTPYWKNIRIDWGALQVKRSYPASVPALFSGDLLTIYGRISEIHNTTITLTAEGPSDTYTWQADLDSRQLANDDCVPVLMARAAIRELENEGTGSLAKGSQQRSRVEKNIRRQVIDLGCTYQLVSSETSFVAIETRQDGAQQERAELRRISVALIQGWGEDGQELYEDMDSLRAPNYINRPSNMESRIDQIDVHHVEDYSPRMCKELEHRPSNCEGPLPRPDSCLQAPDALIDLIALQHADGTWKLDEDLSDTTGIDVDVLKKVAESLNISRKLAYLVTATLAALEFLHREFPDREDEWKLPAKKAEEWLAAQNVHVPEAYDTLEEWFSDVLEIQ